MKCSPTTAWRVFTSNSNFKIPPGITVMTAELWSSGGSGGGGGGAGLANKNGLPGQGGGAGAGSSGAYLKQDISVTPGETLKILVGPPAKKGRGGQTGQKGIDGKPGTNSTIIRGELILLEAFAGNAGLAGEPGGLSYSPASPGAGGDGGDGGDAVSLESMPGDGGNGGAAGDMNPINAGNGGQGGAGFGGNPPGLDGDSGDGAGAEPTEGSIFVFGRGGGGGDGGTGGKCGKPSTDGDHSGPGVVVFTWDPQCQQPCVCPPSDNSGYYCEAESTTSTSDCESEEPEDCVPNMTAMLPCTSTTSRNKKSTTKTIIPNSKATQIRSNVIRVRSHHR